MDQSEGHTDGPSGGLTRWEQLTHPGTIATYLVLVLWMGIGFWIAMRDFDPTLAWYLSPLMFMVAQKTAKELVPSA